MGEFTTELEIVQGRNFAIKAPAGFRVEDWKSRSGRPGEVLYSKYSTDYINSDCFITVSTIAKDPITSEIRKRIERNLGQDGFTFSFEHEGGRHIVYYSNEAESDYKTYHAMIVMTDKKAVMMDVVFNGAYDNAKELAKTIISSIRTNFAAEATEEELALDAARLEAEDRADAAKEAAKRAQMQAASGQEQDPVHVAEMVTPVEEEVAAAQAVVPVEETPEPAADAAPQFDDSEEGQQQQVIYNELLKRDRMTLSELQTVPQLADLGRMGITKLMNVMIREKVLIRFEEADNIYFSVPGKEPKEEPQEAVQVAESELDPMEQYKIDMEKYKAAMKEWKNSKDFFGRTDKPKPVEPVKPKKKR
ncbi:MAG: hypothetical protein SOT70_01090 [Lachnospiraceae bacterium]|nr:hypothetical protein [Lachnospiraceae bacterium]